MLLRAIRPLASIVVLGSIGSLAIGQAVYTVPSTNFPTISAALNVAAGANPPITINVLPGEYYENLSIPNGIDVVLQSTNGPAVTIIDGGGVGRCLEVGLNQTTATVIRGFTFRNGLATPLGPPAPNNPPSGGGVLIRNCSATLENNIIFQNQAASGGGIAIISEQNNPPTGVIPPIGSVIRNNRIIENSATLLGGGVYISDFRGMASTLIFDGNIVAGNTADNGNPTALGAQGLGGGIYTQNLEGAGVSMSHNTITDNTARLGGSGMSIFGGPGAPFSVRNCIIYGNSFGIVQPYSTDSNVIVEDGLNITFTGCNADELLSPGIPISGVGNIYAPPQFGNPASRDYHLQITSPCVDTGVALGSGVAPLDIDGNDRPSGAAPDMGADERDRAVYGIGNYGVAGGPMRPLEGFGSAFLTTMDVHFVGQPNDAVLYVWGAIELSPPLSTVWGDLYIDPNGPYALFDMGVLPATGETNLIFVPGGIPTFSTIPSQGFFNLNWLSPLYRLTVL